MSRMIAYVARAPMATEHALGPSSLSQFLALSAVHSDGWGTAWVDPATGVVLTAGTAGPDFHVDDIARELATPAAARVLYLRFASRGAPPSTENTQPFIRNGMAFQHNGLISPRHELLTLLSEQERDTLRGTTDSEAYFSIARRDVRQGDAGVGAHARIALTIRELRATFPAACLNAMLLSGDDLCVVHSPGTSKAPLAAFQERGIDPEDLPPEHDENYNVLRMTSTTAGARVVATTGLDQQGWTRLAADTVFHMTPSGIVGARIPGG